MLIHLIRHTTPNIEPGICYGNSDIGLVDTFETERDLVLAKLSNHYDAVFTSPLIRCTQLADYIMTAKTVNAKALTHDERLKEYNFGDWELQPWSDLTGKDVQYWMDNYVSQSAPNGDSVISMKKRVDDFWHELLDKEIEKVAIVSHAGVLRLVHAAILDTPLRYLFRLQLNYGAVLEIQYDKNSNLQTIKHL